MIDNRNKQVSFSEATKQFFTGIFDWNGYSSRFSYGIAIMWMVIIGFAFGIVMIAMLIPIIYKAQLNYGAASFNYGLTASFDLFDSIIKLFQNFVVLAIVFALVFGYLTLAIGAVTFRRLHDIGFSLKGSLLVNAMISFITTITMALPIWIFVAVAEVIALCCLKSNSVNSTDTTLSQLFFEKENPVEELETDITFVQGLSNFIKGYFDFSDRKIVSKKEYIYGLVWYIIMITVLLFIGIASFTSAASNSIGYGLSYSSAQNFTGALLNIIVLVFILFIVISIPAISLYVRRLRSVGYLTPAILLLVVAPMIVTLVFNLLGIGLLGSAFAAITSSISYASSFLNTGSLVGKNESQIYQKLLKEE